MVSIRQVNEDVVLIHCKDVDSNGPGINRVVSTRQAGHQRFDHTYDIFQAVIRVNSVVHQDKGGLSLPDLRTQSDSACMEWMSLGGQWV